MCSLYFENKRTKNLNEKCNASLGSLIFGNLFKEKIFEKEILASIKNILAPVNYNECVICMDDMPLGTRASRNTGSCYHKACIECIRSYFMNTLKNDRYISSYDYIQCPTENCKQTFTTSKFLPSILSKKEAEEWWGAALSRTLIENKVRCPDRNCKAIFDANIKDIKQCTFAECYQCHRGFCMACQEKWHPGVIKIVSDEEQTKKTLAYAQKHNWSRCPRCRQFVERVSGCSAIACRCGAIL
ncbi:hypothetical protein HPULCUR_002506 [Helicostylum pulchrum]|uniref:RBR-type E3 ubiquitin transferase n=1 Tax=Helicostylum pulchrum TaxID=562976 RepID=A0ABP9XQT1_9FUNG